MKNTKTNKSEIQSISFKNFNKRTEKDCQPKYNNI